MKRKKDPNILSAVELAEASERGFSAEDIHNQGYLLPLTKAEKKIRTR